MGILGSAYRALDPLLPFDRQLDPRFGNGILSRDDASGRGILSGPQMAPPMAPQAPQAGVMGFPAVPGPQAPQGPQASPEKPYKPSLVDMIWGVAAGYSPGATRRALMDDDMKRRAAQGQASEREALVQQMRSVITDPREWAVFLQNPEEWSKRNAERYGVQNIAGGNTAMYGDPSAGGSAYTAPEMGVDGGQFYSQTPDGVEFTGRRDPSFAEETGRINATNPIAASDGTVLIDPITRKPVYQNAKEFAPRAPAAAGGGKRPGGSSAALGAIEAELRRRKLIP